MVLGIWKQSRRGTRTPPRSPRDTRDALALRRGPGRGPGRRAVPHRRRPREGGRDRRVARDGPGGLVPSGAAPEDVAGAIKVVLRSLPEPLLSFSCTRLSCKPGRKADVAYVAELAALLSPPRRATLTCVLAALARRGAHAGSTSPRSPAPCHRASRGRGGQTQPRRAQSLRRGKDDGGKTARELRAVANALSISSRNTRGFA